MKEQRQEDNNNEQQQVQPVQIKEQMRKIQLPEEQYSVNEIFSIRKQSSNMANDLIYKKLTRSFQKIKKLRADPNSNYLISKQYDYDSDPVRKAFKRARQLFNLETKANMIVKKKIDKIRNKVDKVKNQVQTSELSLISEVDINKIYARSTDLNKHNLGGQQSGTQGTPIREKDKSK